ncbi:hypothetical protein FKG94_11010 [Exilibacterium tricleocarpae]|uniref:Serine aminopeptidase S33 domain-containing protein n=2 Tax=Exilibacterium tricleocarpae TaxID=2591008 RepID=A0A545TSL7_9GAMM|nr:hypothetical protein FKG94_11010 [Exilibacterium tricleocarpae]
MNTTLDAFAVTPKAVDISGPCGLIEARYTGAKAGAPLSKAALMAVVCHPHPLHGGTMTNKVVTTLSRAYRDLGVPVATFNFRGVGRSAGTFDEAVGEVDDLLAVATWMRERFAQRRLLLAGFSFGSSIAAQACYRVAAPAHLTLVAPAIDRYPYDREGRFPVPVCVIQGGRDELVDAAGVHAWSAGLAGTVDLLRFDEASHFFHGALVTMKAELARVLLERLGGS